jgi:hypothetical protein
MAAFDPVTVDMDLWRGNNVPPLVWSLIAEDENGADIPFPMTGSVWRLTVRVRSVRLFTKTSAVLGSGFAADQSTSDLTWTPSIEESRLVPLGALTTYEVERRIGGTQETWIIGTITGRGGINDDE